MDISSLIKAIFDPRLNTSAFIQDIIKVGDVFSLKIVQLKDDHRALVAFGKFRALAEIKFPVKEGALYLVKVTDTNGRLRLQLIDPQINAAAGRKNIFSPFESKILDAKSLSRFKGGIDLLLADIAHQQSRAVHKHNLPDPYHVFSFALPLKENQQKAQLKLYNPRKKKQGSKSGFKISLLLDMNRIGEVRTDFFLLKKDLVVTFFVKDDARKKTFEDNLNEVTDRLKALFGDITVRTVVSEKKIQDFHREDLDLTRDRQIDLRI